MKKWILYGSIVVAVIVGLFVIMYYTNSEFREGFQEGRKESMEGSMIPVQEIHVAKCLPLFIYDDKHELPTFEIS